MKGMLEPLRQRFRRWARPRAPELLPAQIDRHRIYVLPTATGLFFGLLLGTMLVGALNFNNNPALLLGLLIAGTAQASLIAAHLQLSGIRITAASAEPVAAGEDIALRLAMETRDARSRRGLRIDCDQRTAFTALDARGGAVELHLPTSRRGLLPLPRIELSTVQPLGLARAWAYVWPAQSVLVYPAPEVTAPPAPAATGGQTRPLPARAGDELHHLRDYRPGDAPRAIAWKPSARRGALLVRDHEQPRGGELHLDWDATVGLPYEQRIRRLARWVDDAERSGRRYALRLPGTESVALGQGAAQRHQCLRALALLPGEGGVDG